VSLSLDSRARTALTVLDEVIGCTLTDALEPGVVALINEIAEKTRNSTESLESPHGPVNAGTPQCELLHLTINAVDLSRTGSWLHLTFDGDFDGELFGSVLHDQSDGDGLEEIQGDSEVAGMYSLTAGWDLTSGSGAPEEAYGEITHWARADVLLYAAGTRYLAPY
jgi:hypothetical protein